MRSSGADDEGREGLKNCTRKAASRLHLGRAETDNKSVPAGLEEKTGSKLGGSERVARGRSFGMLSGFFLKVGAKLFGRR